MIDTRLHTLLTLMEAGSLHQGGARAVTDTARR